MAALEQQDPEVANIIRREEERERDALELIASENYTSAAVHEAVGSVLTNKYAEGYPGHRYYSGCGIVDEAELLAIDRAKRLFKAEHANVQPHSGAEANMAAYFSLMELGDPILSMSLSQGGHVTHGLSVNYSAWLYRFIHYGVERETGLIDYDQMRELAQKQPAEGYPSRCNCLSPYNRFCEGKRDRRRDWGLSDDRYGSHCGLGCRGGSSVPCALCRCDHFNSTQDVTGSP